MPRLLLVDDNPSIHKIAETLLAATDVHLTCAASGAEALALVERGEAFDVALLDTSMMTMDGWELLDRLRGLEATARIPVAMMAGVLDVVDPERISQAPIQGFLKKPVELRDLGDRIKRLMETPVPPPAPRPAPEPEPEPEAASPYLTQPGFRIADHPELARSLEPAALEDDLLLLGPEDVYRGDAEPEPSPLIEEAALQAANDTLDLEELDIDSLRGLSLQPEQPLVAFEEPESFKAPEAFTMGSAPEDAPTVEELPSVPEYGLGDAFPSAQDMDERNTVTTGELPDLGPEEEAPAPAPEPAAVADSELFDWSDDSDSLVVEAPGSAAAEAESLAPGDLLESAQPADEAPAGAEEGLDLDLISDVILTGDLGLAADVTTHLGEFELPEAAAAPVPEPQAAFDPRVDTGKIQGFNIQDLLEQAGAAAPPAEAAASLAEAGFMVEAEFPEEAPEPAAPEAEPESPAEAEAAVEATPVGEAEAQTEPEIPMAAEAVVEPEAEVEAVVEAEVEPLAEAEALAVPEIEPATEVEAVAEPELPGAVAAELPPAAQPEPQPAVAGAGIQPSEALAVLLADPVLMDQLARAVVARLGEQALREIAWEIMPELADRLQRN